MQQVTEQQARQAVCFAAKHVNNGAAFVEYQRASWCLDQGQNVYAVYRAKNSLEHSVGVNHPDYAFLSKTYH